MGFLPLSRVKPEGPPQAEAPGAPPLTPEAFLETQEELLTSSHYSWQLVSDSFRLFEEEEFNNAISGCIERYVDNRGGHEEQRRREKQSYLTRARRLPDDLASYTLAYTSYIAPRSGNWATRARKLARNLATTPNLLVNNVIISTLEDPRYFSEIIDISRHIQTGNKLREEIVGNFAGALRQKPSLTSELNALPANSPYRAHLSELKKACAVDWYLPNPNESILRRYLAEVEDDPDLQLEAFIDSLEVANGNKDREHICELGRFSLASSGVDLSTNPSIREVMAKSRSQWDFFPAVENAFKEFCRGKIRQQQHEVSTFVGPEHAARRSIRFPRTKSDLETLKTSFAGYFESDTVSKKHRRAASTAVLASSIPDARTILAEHDNGFERFEESPDLELATVKLGPNGAITFRPANIDDVLECFRSNFRNDPQLSSEIKRMVIELINDPRGRTTKNVVPNNVNVRPRVDGKLLQLRRYAPSGHLGVSKNGSRYRIVYTVTDGKLAFFDIIHHDDFDTKYK